MLSQLALTPIFGKPAIMYGGLLTLVVLITVAVIGYRIFKGKCKFKNPIRAHQIAALLLLILAAIHAVLGLAIMFGY